MPHRLGVAREEPLRALHEADLLVQDRHPRPLGPPCLGKRQFLLAQRQLIHGAHSAGRALGEDIHAATGSVQIGRQHLHRIGAALDLLFHAVGVACGDIEEFFDGGGVAGVEFAQRPRRLADRLGGVP